MDTRTGRRPHHEIAGTVGLSERQIVRIRQRFADVAEPLPTRTGTPKRVDDKITQPHRECGTRTSPPAKPPILVTSLPPLDLSVTMEYSELGGFPP